MQSQNIISLRLLLAVQRKGEAVDIRLSDHEALLGFAVGSLCQVYRFFGAPDQGLLDIEVADRHNHVFFDRQLFLFGGCLCDKQVVLGNIMFPFSHAPVHQWDRNGQRDDFLLLQIFVGILYVLGHLVEADTGVDLGIKHGFFLCFVYLLLSFQHLLFQVEESRIVFTRQFERLVD